MQKIYAQQKMSRRDKVKKKEDKTVQVKITFTDGYERRFTQAVLKIFAKRLHKSKEKQRAAG